MNASKANTNLSSGAAIAAAAASLFLNGMAGVSPAKAAEAKVQCAGVNSCKGKSECSTAANACQGQNACKGKGWLSMSEKQCVAKGGKPEKS
jgi:uncharacterized membrane protein